MINHHQFLHSFLDQTLNVVYQGQDYQVNFAEGDLFELWKVLQSKKQKYPIIWLQTGYNVINNIRGNRVELQKLRFFFITKGSANDFYKKRFADTFNDILYPLFNDFINLINTTQGISLANDTFSFTSLPFNDLSEIATRTRDYGNKIRTQNTTTPDFWDAIVLDINLAIDPNCHNLKPYKI